MSFKLFLVLSALRLHAHRCHTCQHAFVHSDSNACNDEAHRCPKCGSPDNWERILPRQLAISD